MKAIELILGEAGLKQNLYDHGGSRIYTEIDGKRILICDTYHTEEFALAVRDFTEKWLKESGEPNAKQSDENSQ